MKNTRSRINLLSVIIVAAITAAAVTIVPRAMAATWYVDGNVGNDASSCMAPGLTACRTIQAAIDKASAGDTIIVAASIYPEPAPGPLTVNKTLTLLGSQAGVDARTRLGAESVVNDPQGTSVSANNVVLDGFTFQGSSSAFPGFGIWLNPGISGTAISNNIIQNNIVGIGLANNGAQAVISQNLIQNNNVPGAATGSGIYTDQFSGGPVVRNVLIEENAFVGNNVAAINISNTDPNGGVFDVKVLNNSFDANGRALLLFNSRNWTIQENTIANSTAAGSAAIRLLDNNRNIDIRLNDLMVGAGDAIRITFIGAVGGPSSGVEIHQNNIEFFARTGLTVDPNGHVGTVDAECNWWNSPTGPINPSNPGGTGEEVVGDADFTPWLIAPAPGGPCLGGVPSTPGKVTGGGQVAGSDPLFSPLGELLSIPALLPSLTQPNAKASFGFVVRCCPAKGNLEYNDHEMDVRIKARSIDSLVIEPGPCGAGTRATFTGRADVIRPTGTTDEFMIVEVDDCGEPGTLDTFRIQVETYVNGPSPLLGGNIQIHR